MHAPTLERRLAAVPLEDLHAHPDNARGALKAADVESLTESIRARGILTPLMVRDMPLAQSGYQILAGHRRLIAARAVGLTSVPCQVVSLDDDEARAVVLLENLDREDPDLFRQADLVSRLMAARNGEVADVALLTGKSRHWVATMRAIAGLEPGVRKTMQSERCDWTVPMVMLFARLAHDVQKARWEEVRHARDLQHLQGWLEKDFHVLGKAPFDTQDERLVPKAGSCASCPKTSARAPGLFDAEDLDPAQPAQLKKATCRDGACWQAKCMATAAAKVKTIADKAGRAPLILMEGSEFFGLPPKDPVRALGQVASTYDVKTSKEGAKGAVPAVTLEDGKVGPVRWVLPPAARGAAGKAAKATKAKAPAKPPTEAQRLERFLQRRAAWIVDHVHELVSQTKVPPYRLVRGLVAAFGCGLIGAYDARRVKRGGLDEFLDGVLHDDKAWAARVWPHMKHHAATQLQRGTLEEAPEQLKDAIVVYSLLEELPLGEARDYLQISAEKAMPTPLALRGALIAAQGHVDQEERAAKGRRAKRTTGKAAAAADASAE